MWRSVVEDLAKMTGDGKNSRKWKLVIVKKCLFSFCSGSAWLSPVTQCSRPRARSTVLGGSKPPFGGVFARSLRTAQSGQNSLLGGGGGGGDKMTHCKSARATAASTEPLAGAGAGTGR